MAGTDSSILCSFTCFALLTLGGAVLTITRRSAVHSAISLIVSLLGVAGLYLLQHAEFLFAVQIVLYIGGIMVLFLFVIMLVNLDEAAKQSQFNKQWWLALGCGSLVGARDRCLYLAKGAGHCRCRAPAPSAARRQHRADRRRRCSAITCCLSRSLPCCCWWRLSARWSWRRRGSDDAPITTGHYLVLSTALLLIGTLGVLTRRNIVIILMSIELILNAVNINLIAFSRHYGIWTARSSRFSSSRWRWRKPPSVSAF